MIIRYDEDSLLLALNIVHFFPLFLLLTLNKKMLAGYFLHI